MKTGLAYSLLFFMLFPALGLADCILPAYKAKYSAYIKGTNTGFMTQKLSYTRNTYKYVSITNLHYLLYRDRLSHGVRGYVRDNKLVPIRYFYGAKSKGPNRFYMIKKDHFDIMSYQLKLRRELLAGKSTFSFRVLVGKRKVMLDYHVIQRGYYLSTPLGSLETVIVAGRNPYGADMTFWFAKKYHFLMVKSQLRRGSTVLGTMNIKNYKENTKGPCPIKALKK